MREIKFRCWNIPMKRMYYFGLYNVYGDETMPVMQYTGLKDKNGKEIYEWDVVKAISYDSPTYRNKLDKWKVFFKDGEFCASNKDDTVGLHYWHSTELEVIGNIYEHPELLKEGYDYHRADNGGGGKEV